MSPAIRNLDSSETKAVMEWARLEGWNPGLNDGEIFYKISPRGLWGAFVDDQLAASVSLVNYKDRFGFLGLYICRPDFRGRGIGLALWSRVMEINSNLPIIGLDGVVQQQENYKKSGFIYAFANSRFGGLKPNYEFQMHPMNWPPFRPDT